MDSVSLVDYCLIFPRGLPWKTAESFEESFKSFFNSIGQVVTAVSVGPSASTRIISIGSAAPSVAFVWDVKLLVSTKDYQDKRDIDSFLSKLLATQGCIAVNSGSAYIVVRSDDPARYSLEKQSEAFRTKERDEIASEVAEEIGTEVEKFRTPKEALDHVRALAGKARYQKALKSLRRAE